MLSHTTLRSGHPLDEAVSDHICHIPHNHFPPELEPPKSLNQETKDDPSALRFCRIVRPPQDLDQEHQGTRLLSLSPLHTLDTSLHPPSLHYFPSSLSLLKAHGIFVASMFGVAEWW